MKAMTQDITPAKGSDPATTVRSERRTLPKTVPLQPRRKISGVR
jgi:hypothetical protein